MAVGVIGGPIGGPIGGVINIAQGTFADATGTAQGDSTASGVFLATSNQVGTAQGDSTASGALLATSNQVGTAQGDSTASGTLRANSNQVGTAQGDATASGTLTATSNQVGTAQGDATASGTITALATFTGTAQGDATADGVSSQIATIDATGTAQGDSTASGIIVDATPPVVVATPAQVTAGGVGVKAWASYRRKSVKKPSLIEELDELIAEAKARIVEVEEEDDPYAEVRAAEIRAALSALSRQNQVSLEEIKFQIGAMKRLIQEIDDEEVFLLLAA